LKVLSEIISITKSGYNIQSNLYKGNSWEHENVPFISCCILYTGLNYMHYSFMGEMRLPFIDSDLLYKVPFIDSDLLYKVPFTTSLNVLAICTV